MKLIHKVPRRLCFCKKCTTKLIRKLKSHRTITRHLRDNGEDENAPQPLLPEIPAMILQEGQKNKTDQLNASSMLDLIL